MSIFMSKWCFHPNPPSLGNVKFDLQKRFACNCKNIHRVRAKILKDYSSNTPIQAKHQFGGLRDNVIWNHPKR